MKLFLILHIEEGGGGGEGVGALCSDYFGPPSEERVKTVFLQWKSNVSETVLILHIEEGRREEAPCVQIILALQVKKGFKQYFCNVNGMFLKLFQLRVSSKQTKKKFGSNRNKTNKICFGCVSVCFVKPKPNIFGLFRCFKPISKQLKQTELFQNKPKQPKILQKNTKICSLSNHFGWPSVCFGSKETSKLSVSV